MLTCGGYEWTAGLGNREEIISISSLLPNRIHEGYPIIMENAEQKTVSVRQFISNALSIGYDGVIILVACGVFGAALILLYDIVTDFIYLGSPNHMFSHLISDLMLTLIIMALLNQVIQLIRNQPFALLPFIAIGLIASVRGFLIAQIKVGLGEIEWTAGLIQLGSYSFMIIAMAACFHIFSKGKKEHG